MPHTVWNTSCLLHRTNPELDVLMEQEHPMLDRTATKFSHVKPGDTQFVSGGLRDFFLYRDLGIADATNGQVIAHLEGEHGTGNGHGLAPP